MTWVSLSGGFFLCLLSGTVLRKAFRLRSTYARTIQISGLRNVPMMPLQVGTLAGWGAVFIVGCGFMTWGIVM